MPSIDIHNCLMGAITSRVDHSVAFRVITPELRASESGALMGLHGCSVRVVLFPHDKEIEEVSIKTEREQKSNSARFRAVLFVAWKEGAYDKREGESFDAFYDRQYDKMITFWKEKLP